MKGSSVPPGLNSLEPRKPRVEQDFAPSFTSLRVSMYGCHSYNSKRWFRTWRCTMDSHTWQSVYRTIKQCGKMIPRAGRRPVFSDTLIAAMYLWSVAHDRPMCWACRRANYTSRFRPRRLPSVSQFCRRVQTPRIQRLLEAVHDRLTDAPCRWVRAARIATRSAARFRAVLPVGTSCTHW
jgi:hypothetical protein